MTDLAGGEYMFGPPVSVRTDIGSDLYPINIDLERLGQNLQKDFPGLTQEDWNKTRVVLADLGPDIGGVSAELSFRRRSFAARYIGGLMSFFLRHPSVAKSFRKLNSFSEGADVITLVNAASEKEQLGEGQNPFVDSTYRTSVSEILAHELKHTADTLYQKQHDDLIDPKKLDRHNRVGAIYLTVTLGGLAVAGAGGLESMYLIYGWNEKLAEVGGASLIGGISVAATPVYLAIKHGKLDAARFGYEAAGDPVFSTGEEAAYAYQLATKNNWNGVLTAGKPN